MMKKILIFTLLLSLIIYSSYYFFVKKASSTIETPYPEEGWEVASEDEVIFPEDRKQGLLHALEKRPEIHTMLVIKEGKVVVDYGHGLNSNDSIYSVNSVTKSVLSILIGMAIHNGHMEGANQPIEDFIPEIKDMENYETLKTLTIKDLLTMRSGLRWNKNLETAYKGQRDMIDYVLNRPFVQEPDTQFTYNSGTSNLLAIILERATGQSLLDFAEENLFSQLKIDKYEWEKQGEHYRGGRGLFILPYDLAKLGYLMLHDGVWEEERLLPEGWVEESTNIYSDGRYINTDGYGYQWWVGKYAGGKEYFFGYGDKGQNIFVIPEEDLVVVFTARILDNDLSIYYALLRNYLIDYIEIKR
ncbi:serine hydrolase [Bacillus sp. THAF10]|uniref:serine hydrolase domain-containing protein n=1 Tax=Bacillus sp. THAF10 TaxID=2587848 RepID=UPI00126914BF|nr:serine hydrolase [Bacillus sp. THAF10]